MDYWISYASVALLAMSLISFLAQQVKHTLEIHRNKTIPVSKNDLIGNSLIVLTSIGCIGSFLLNVLIYSQLLQVETITSNNTAVACFIFFFISMILKYIMTSKEKEVTSSKRVMESLK